MSQVIGPMTQILDSAATSGSSAQNSSEAMAQRTLIRQQLMISVLSISNVSTVSASSLAQSLSAISSITSQPSELSPFVAVAGAEFAAQSMEAVLKNSNKPLPPLLVTSALCIVGSSAAASAASGGSNAAGSLDSVQQKKIRFVFLIRAFSCF